jgi:hypothetical protein
MNAADQKAALAHVLDDLRPHASSGELRRPGSGPSAAAFYQMHITYLADMELWAAWCEPGQVGHARQRRLVHAAHKLDDVLDLAERRIDSKLGGRSARYHCHAGHARFTHAQIGQLRQSAA